MFCWLRATSSALSLLLLTGACHGPYQRTPLSKGVLFDVVVSNSVMHTEKLTPTRATAGYVLDYAIVLENLGSRPVTLPLEDVSASADDLSLVTACAVQQLQKKELVVGPHERYRVDCTIRISDDLRQRLRHSDAQLSLTVPIARASEEGKFQFQYRLFKGDAG